MSVNSESSPTQVFKPWERCNQGSQLIGLKPYISLDSATFPSLSLRRVEGF
jgi:hypothetical protein